jgi:hypothetical protein
VRRILSGTPAEEVANAGAMANPESLDFFMKLAAARKKGGPPDVSSRPSRPSGGSEG